MSASEQTSASKRDERYITAPSGKRITESEWMNGGYPEWTDEFKQKTFDNFHRQEFASPQQQPDTQSMIDVIKTLVYRSLQWEDGEIKGWDERMIESLAPLLMKPFVSPSIACEVKAKEGQDIFDVYYDYQNGYHVRENGRPMVLLEDAHRLLQAVVAAPQLWTKLETQWTENAQLRAEVERLKKELSDFQQRVWSHGAEGELKSQAEEIKRLKEALQVINDMELPLTISDALSMQRIAKTALNGKA